MGGYAPRAPGDIVRPRRLADVGARPLNFTVRGRSKNPPQGRDPDSTRKGQDPSLNASACARAGNLRGHQAKPAPVAALCRGCASAGRSGFVASVSFGLR